MPIYGQGIIPALGSSTPSVASELGALTNRAFLPKLFVQIYQASPLLAALIKNAQMASGGVSPITAPVQGNAMTTGQWTGYDGSFNQPGVIPGVQNAEFNLKNLVIPIVFLNMEALVQIDYSIIPVIEARVNDATNQGIQLMTTALYNNISNTQQMIGLPGAIDDGTNASTYGGIARSSQNSSGTYWWKSTYVSNSGSAVAPTRQLIMQYIAQVTKKNGEMPKMGIMGLGTWTKLTQDFNSLEQYNITDSGAYSDGPGAKSYFRNLSVGGVPIYCDPTIPEGVLYLLNTDYLSLYLHERANFEFTGFESLLSNSQLGYVGAVVTACELVNVKPQAHGSFANLSYLNI